MTEATIVVAGATGNLGARIAQQLRTRGATVRALVRPGTAPDRLEGLRRDGVELVEVDFEDAAGLTRACTGASCVVSALAGLREVIVDTQTRLLEAAVLAKVPRFIPSDFSIDFTGLTPGRNRNLDLRREFHQRLDRAPIQATSIFNGAFMDLLTGQAPFILFSRKRVLCWGNPDQRMDFTSIPDTAAFTAAAALDPSTPRKLCVAGDQLSARGMAELMTELSGTPYRVLRPGGLGLFNVVIRITRTVAPGGTAVTPPWQGMQYMRDMFSGRATHTRLDNDRYPGLTWTRARSLLAARATASS